MDMSKAFDSLVPYLLLSKLRAYGLSDSSVSLLESFFTGRKSRVRLGNVTSDWKSISRGCPQGSSLGPVLWNLYQNDVFYESTKSQLSAYADDHQLYLSDHDPGKVIGGLEEDGKVIPDWYKSNHLTGNLFKYQVLILSKSAGLQARAMCAAGGSLFYPSTRETKGSKAVLAVCRILASTSPANMRGETTGAVCACMDCLIPKWSTFSKELVFRALL